MYENRKVELTSQVYDVDDDGDDGDVAVVA